VLRLVLILIAASSIAPGDRLALTAHADALGPAGLARALRGSRRERLLALAAAPEAGAPWALIDDVLQDLGPGDQQVARAAARALLAIVRDLPRETVVQQEIPDDILARAQAAAARVARHAGLAVDVRATAAQAAIELGASRGQPDDDLVLALVVDGDPELRRAAAELGDVSRPAIAAAFVARAAVEEVFDVQAALLAAWARAGLALPVELRAIAARIVAEGREDGLASKANLILIERGLAKR
jgi:hypothetical protein